MTGQWAPESTLQKFKHFKSSEIFPSSATLTSRYKMATEEMKLIKTSTTRTSQACDRCRIKKIKCDGLLPACSNCLKIGYNCKVSDKLTRRAFPRGYTENLEKNMITLQNEILKLNEQLSEAKSKSSSGAKDASGDSVELKQEPNSEGLAGNSTKKGHSSSDLSINFFKYDNYIHNDQYLGLNSLQSIFNTLLVDHGLFTDIKESKDDDVSSFLDGNFIQDKFINNFPSKHNLDLIIQQHFQKMNKLIPIVDENTFFAKYKAQTSILNINGTIQYDPLTNHDFTIQMILIIQLNCSIFSIHDIHKLVTLQINIISSPSLIKYENLLLSLWLFHNKNCYSSTVISISNLLKAMTLTLGLHLNYNNLISSTTFIEGSQSTVAVKQLVESKEEKFKRYSQRLKLFWCFHILNRLTSIVYGLPDASFFESFHIPKLSTLVNFNEDLRFPLKLIELLDHDFNLLDFSDKGPENYTESWFLSLDTDADLQGDDVVKLQLKLFGLIFKILLKVGDVVESSRTFLEIMLNLNDSKETGLNNFEFHIIPFNFVKIMIVALFKLLPHETPTSIDLKTSILVKETIDKSIKLRYPENYLLFKDILNYIIDRSTPVLHTRSSVGSTHLSSVSSLNDVGNPETYQSLFPSNNHSHSSIGSSSQYHSASGTSAKRQRTVSVASSSSTSGDGSVRRGSNSVNLESSSNYNTSNFSSLRHNSINIPSIAHSSSSTSTDLINILNTNSGDALSNTDENQTPEGKVGILFDWSAAANSTAGSTGDSSALKMDYGSVNPSGTGAANGFDSLVI